MLGTVVDFQDHFFRKKYLIQAAQRGQTAAIDWITQTYPHVVGTKEGRIAIRMAAANCDAEMLRLLLGAYQRMYGEAKLHRLLLGSSGESLLMTVAKHQGNPEHSPRPMASGASCVDVLLEFGADLLYFNAKGDSCLHVASHYNHAAFVERLLSLRLSWGTGERLAGDVIISRGGYRARFVDFPNRAGLTPLMTAAKQDSHGAVRALLQGGHWRTRSFPNRSQKSWDFAACPSSRPLRQCGWLRAVPPCMWRRGATPTASASLLMEHPISGEPLSEVRNSRGLSALDIAASHVSPMPHMVRVLRRQLVRRPSVPPQLASALENPSFGQQSFVDPDLLLLALVKRAGLILSLRNIAMRREFDPSDSPDFEDDLKINAESDMAAVVDSVAVVWSRVGEDAADLLSSLRTCLALMSGSLGLPTGVPESPSSGRWGRTRCGSWEGAPGKQPHWCRRLRERHVHSRPHERSPGGGSPCWTSLPPTPLAAAMVLQAVVRLLSATPREMLEAVQLSTLGGAEEGGGGASGPPSHPPGPSLPPIEPPHSIQAATDNFMQQWRAAASASANFAEAMPNQAIPGYPVGDASTSGSSTQALQSSTRPAVAATPSPTAGPLQEAREGTVCSASHAGPHDTCDPWPRDDLEGDLSGTSGSFVSGEAGRDLRGGGVGSIPNGSPVGSTHMGPELQTTTSGNEWLMRASLTRLDLSQASLASDPAEAASATIPQESCLGAFDGTPVFQSYASEDDDPDFAGSPGSPHSFLGRIPHRGPMDRSKGTEAERDPLGGCRDAFRPGPDGESELGLEHQREDPGDEWDSSSMSRLYQTHSADSWLRQIQYARIDLSPALSPLPVPLAGPGQVRQPVPPADVPPERAPGTTGALVSAGAGQAEIPGGSLPVPSGAEPALYLRPCGSHDSFLTVSSMEDCVDGDALGAAVQKRSSSPEDRPQGRPMWPRQAVYSRGSR
eukprot:jgi/Botrbrau1/11555/Bobra.60_1s0009.1